MKSANTFHDNIGEHQRKLLHKLSLLGIYAFMWDWEGRKVMDTGTIGPAVQGQSVKVIVTLLFGVTNCLQTNDFALMIALQNISFMTRDFMH
jgi:hypothetical protein